MSTDFRVSVDFFTHHKARKLRKRLGAAALLSLIQLWAYAAKVRTDGDLSDMDAEAVELAAEWDGEDGAFCATLLDIGFLDQTEDGLVLHNWAENNPWVAEEKFRRERAQKGAQARWDKEKTPHPQASSNAPSVPEQCSSNAEAMHPQASSNAPSPKPIPKPEDIKTPPIPPQGGQDEDVPPAFAQFWKAYPKKTGKNAALKAWKKARDKPPLPAILAALERQKTWPQWQRDGGQYIPNPSTWLNQGRWNDEPPETQSRASPPGRAGFGRYGGEARDYGQSDFGALGGNST